MEDGNAYTIVVVAFFGVLTASIPLMMQWQKSRSDRVIREEDRAARQLVADLAAKAVATLEKKSVEDALTLRQINEKQDVIHLLVNSNLTAAIQAEHDATARELVTLLELMDIKKSMGREATKESIASVEVARAKLTDLRAKLEDRARQAKVVEAEQKRQQNVTTSQKLALTTGGYSGPIPVKVVESASDPVNVVAGDKPG